MLLRNRELFRAAVAWAAIACALALGAWALSGAGAAAWCALSCAAAALPLAVHTRWRYRRIAELTSRVDAVLHGERDVDLDRMSEGELAILASEIDKMVTRLIVSADELDRERRMLADALADISHQLKTPLTSLAISTELVRRHLAESGAAPGEIERLRKIQQLEDRIERLVSTLLKLARIDAGVVRLAHAEVRAADLVDDAFAPLAVAFDIAGVAFEKSVDPEAAFMGDGAWSAEALGNILKNCMEHTPAGGAVAVRAHEDALACRIVVEDTGPGIAPEDLPHVFERFYRGTGSDAGEVNPAGAGIGLSLARSLVAAQGGTLSAENALDAEGRVTGARFTMAFFKTTV